ncbi:hypothetical protein DRO61_04450, partial [Candidatus Bathyarchaeota archaeon]
ASGGQIYGFNRGGMVPGTGNRDTVPAMLTPGEFVIKKSSVESIGAGTLASMNKFNNGGTVIAQVKRPQDFGAFIAKQGGTGKIASEGQTIDSAPFNRFLPVVKRAIESQSKPRRVSDTEIDAELKKQESNFFKKDGKLSSPGIKFIKNSDLGATNITNLNPDQQRSFIRQGIQKKLGQPTISPSLSDSAISNIKIKGPFSAFPIAGDGELNQDLQPVFAEAAENALTSGVRVLANSSIIKELDIPPPINNDETKIFDSFKSFFEGSRESLEGFLLEGVIGAVTNATIGGGGTSFDFPNLGKTKASTDRLERLFGNDAGIRALKKADAKRQLSTANSGEGKLVNKIATDGGLGANQISIVQRNKGGGISGEDTVPALLTPGEFVFSKKSASRIGYGNLNRMNKDGVQGFNQGGVVGFQRGGKATGGGSNLLQASGKTAEGLGNLTSTAFLLQGSFTSTGALFEEGGLTFSNVIGSVTTSLFAFQAALQAIQTAQALGGLTNLAGNLKSFSGNIKNLPKTLKGFGNSFTKFGKNIKATGSIGRAAGLAKARGSVSGGNIIDKNIGKLATPIRNLTSTLTKQAGGKGIGAAVSNGLLKLGPSLGTAIGTPLAAGVATAVGTALVAIPIGKFVGEAVGASLDKALFGAREEIAGFQGREGQGAGGAAASGVVKQGLGGAGLGAGVGAAIGSIIPGVGTAIGAAVGAAVGLIAGSIAGAINGPLEQASFEAAKKLQKDTEELGKSLEQFAKSGSIADFDSFLDDFLAQGDATTAAFDTFTNQFDNQVSLLDFTGLGVISDTFNSFGKLLQGDVAGAAKASTLGKAAGRIGQVAGTAASTVGGLVGDGIDLSNLGKSLDDAIKRVNPFEGTRLAQIVNTQFGGAIAGLNFERIGKVLGKGAENIRANIKKFGEGVAKGADEAFKSLTGVSFGEAKKNIEDGLKKASDVFNQGVTAAFRATPIGLVSFLLGPAEAAADNAEEQAKAAEEQAKREAQARGKAAKVTKNQLKAVERIQTLIDPKQVEEARKALSQGLQKLVEAGELGVDFEGLDVSTKEGQQEARSRIRAKAEEQSPEGERARKLLAAESQQITNELAVVSKKFKDGGDKAGKKTGKALDSLQAAILSGQVDPANQEEVNAFLKRFGAAGKDAAKEFEKIAESSDGALGAAVNAGLLAKALKEAEKALNTFNAELKTIQDDLAFATESSAVALSNLKDTTDALSNGQILFTQKLDGFDFGKAGAGARQDRIAAIGATTGVDVEGIQKFDTVIANADEIGKDAFEELKEREKDGKVGLQDVTSALEAGIEKELGFELPEGPLKEGLKKSLEG